MPNIKVSDLPLAEPLTGEELLLGVQDGGSVKIEGQMIAEIPAIANAVAEAQQSADTAAAIVNRYPDTAAGLAATAEGGYFSTPSSIPGIAANIYRKVSGAAVLSARVPGVDEDGKLNPDSIPFITSSNLFDLRAITPGVRLDAGGVLTPDADFYISDFIEAKPGTKYTWSSLSLPKYIGFYNANKNFISRTTGIGSATTPANTAYIRVAPRYSETPPETFMLVEGDLLPSAYQAFAGLSIESKFNRDRLGGYAGLDNAGKLNPGVIPMLPLGVFPSEDPKNLFDPTTITDGGYLNSSDGVSIVSNADFYTSDFIPVDPSATYSWTTTQTGKRVAWYTQSKAFIGMVTLVGSATAPANAFFARICPRHSEFGPDAFMFVQGALPSSYEPYVGAWFERRNRKNVAGGYAGLDADGKILQALLPASAGSPIAGKKFAILGDSIPWGYMPRNDPSDTQVPPVGGTQIQSWYVLAAQALGATYSTATCISGSTLADNGTGANSPGVYRFNNIAADTSIVGVAMGVNDSRKGVALGTFDQYLKWLVDPSDQSLPAGYAPEKTFYGGLHIILRGLIDRFIIQPGVEVGKQNKIFICTPLKNIDEATGLLRTQLEAFCQAIKEVAAYYSVPVLDLYNLSGINPHILQTVQGTAPGYTGMFNPYITDGTHPTLQGHYIIHRVVAGFIRSLY